MATFRFPICLALLIIPALVTAEEFSANYAFRWKVDGSRAIFDIEARTLGWVGLGFNTKASMKGADLIVAGVNITGESFIYDLHGVAHDLPPADSRQDYRVERSSKNDTHTVLSISRLLDTGDSEDYKLTVGSSVTVLYAIGKEIPVNIYNFDAHNQRGTRTITF